MSITILQFVDRLSFINTSAVRILHSLQLISFFYLSILQSITTINLFFKMKVSISTFIFGMAVLSTSVSALERSYGGSTLQRRSHPNRLPAVDVDYTSELSRRSGYYDIENEFNYISETPSAALSRRSELTGEGLEKRGILGTIFGGIVNGISHLVHKKKKNKRSFVPEIEYADVDFDLEA